MIYLLLIIATVYLKGLADIAFQTDISKTYKINYVLLTVITLLAVVVGVVLGLDHLMNEIKKEGKWKISLPKIILLIIPSLYASSIYYLAAINIKFVQIVLIYPVFKFFGSSTTFILIFQIVLGYSIITAFYKGDKKEVNSLEDEEGILKAEDMVSDEDEDDEDIENFINTKIVENTENDDSDDI